MKINDDIRDSGLLEQYLLGELTDQQMQEVESTLEKDADLKSYFQELEHNFEQLGKENSIAPPPIVKNKLLQSIKGSGPEKISSNQEPKNLYRSYLAIAASFAGLMLLGMLWVYSQLNGLKEELKVVQTENEQLQQDLDAANNVLTETSKWYESINDPNVKKYVLTGNQNMPEAQLISYVNHTNKSVIVNTASLPELEDSQDYQMWADVEGEMINMGVIDTNNTMMAMTYIDHAESLNITIEPKGGSDHPTVSQLITNVYLEP